MTTSTLIDPIPSLDAILGHITVSDIMTTDLFVVHPSTPVRDLIELLVERKISGVPVVGETGSPMGVVSMTDVMRLASHELEVGGGLEAEPARPFGDDIDGERPTFFLEASFGPDVVDANLPHTSFDGWTVEDIMTPATFSVRPDATLPELARFLLRGQIHRALVTREGRLLGIVTTFDIVRAVAAGEDG